MDSHALPHLRVFADVARAASALHRSLRMEVVIFPKVPYSPMG